MPRYPGAFLCSLSSGASFLPGSTFPVHILPLEQGWDLPPPMASPPTHPSLTGSRSDAESAKTWDASPNLECVHGHSWNMGQSSSYCMGSADGEASSVSDTRVMGTWVKISHKGSPNSADGGQRSPKRRMRALRCPLGAGFPQPSTCSGRCCG